MSCTNPRPAILLPPDENGKQKVKFIQAFRGDQSYVDLKKKYGSMYLEIPCGKCDSCIEMRTKSWAIRCVLEAQEHEKNCFLTLTYNNKCKPKGGLCKRDIQKFIKRLRNKYGSGLRYFGCGEYGHMYDRPHYHAILFGFWPDDAVAIYRDRNTDCVYYRSKELQKLWPFGFVSVGEVSYNSCAYVARYCQKKIADLGIVRMNPEFSFMSRRPGIGEKYFRDHFDSLINTDKIYVHINDSFKFSSFRYFDKLIERVDPEKLQELKVQRISAGEINVASELLQRNISNMADYLLWKEQEIGEKYNRLKRRIE